MSQINIRTDDVAGLMSTVSNMMRQIDNVSSQLSSHMRYIDNSIKSQSNINYRMNCVCNKLNETYNRLSSLLSVMDMAVNTYNDAEQQVIYLTKDLQDIYGRDGSSFLNGVISNIQSFADEAISEVKDIYSDAENTVKSVEKWYDDNKEYIDKLLIDGAVLVVSTAFFVLAPEAAPLIFAVDAYLLAKNAVQVHSDYEALKANEAANDADANGDLEGAKELRDKAKDESKFSMKNIFEIGGGEIFGDLVGLVTGLGDIMGGNNFEDGFNEGFSKGYNSKITKEASDLVYDGVDTTANVISLKNGFKNASEVVDTVRNATNETSKFTKFIKAWDGKAENFFGKDYIDSVKDGKKVLGNIQKGRDVFINIKDGIDNPSNKPTDIKKSLGDIPKFGSTEKDIFDTYDDITSDLGIKTPTNQQN